MHACVLRFPVRCSWLCAGSSGTGTILTAEAGELDRGYDSEVGGILPQIRGESLVFGETEGELKRERDLGYSSENWSKYIGYIFLCAAAIKCRKMGAASLCYRHCTENLTSKVFIFCAVINEGQPLLGSCSGLAFIPS